MLTLKIFNGFIPFDLSMKNNITMHSCSYSHTHSHIQTIMIINNNRLKYYSSMHNIIHISSTLLRGLKWCQVSFSFQSYINGLYVALVYIISHPSHFCFNRNKNMRISLHNNTNWTSDKIFFYLLDSLFLLFINTDYIRKSIIY